MTDTLVEHVAKALKETIDHEMETCGDSCCALDYEKLAAVSIKARDNWMTEPYQYTDVCISVKGNCGKDHKSIEEWSSCKACDCPPHPNWRQWLETWKDV